MFYKKFHKQIAAFLCISLCMGSSPINTIAAENTFVENTSVENISDKEAPVVHSTEDTLNNQSTQAEETDNATVKNQTETNEASEGSQSETNETSSEIQSETDEASSEIQSETDEASEGNQSETNETSSEIQSETDEASSEIQSETDEASSEIQTETDEASTEEFTEEGLFTDQIRTTNIDNATKAFYELLNDKALMALLYHTDSYKVQQYAGAYNDSVAEIYSGHTLFIKGVDFLEEQLWYNVSFWINGEEKSGFIEAYYLAYSDEDWISWEKEYLADIYDGSTIYGITAYSTTTGNNDTSDIDSFPAFYQEDLLALKEKHPNWTFVPMNTGLDFNTAVSNEMGAKSLIQNTSNNVSKGWVGEACPTEGGWYYATKPAISYYMDPCNFLTETYIFQFEQLTFNSTYHSTSALQTFLSNTFMKGAIPSDSENRTYAQAFYEIGKNRKLSPIHLAARVYQEQGDGTSSLISGNYQGYEGYYNYFNVGTSGASNTEKIKRGLEYAKSKGWNTRYKSLEGGAATIGNNYILKGQDTIYLEKFNVDANSPHGLYNHQYMQNIQAPASEASSTKKMYTNAGSLNSGFVFKIPVFKNMPNETVLQSISLDKTDIVLYRPDTIPEGSLNSSSTDKLTVSYTPSDTTSDKTITWSSSNPRVVSVKAGENTQEAVISALEAGNVTITAKSSNGKTAKCNVSVEAPIYSLTLVNLNTDSGIPETSASLYSGQSLTLTADYMPKNTTSDTTIIWSSSDSSVASVADGKVTALSPGTAIISAAISGITSTFEISISDTSVIFMSDDYTGELLKMSIKHGDSLSEDDFPQMQSTSDKLFIGWYTDKNGLGTRYIPGTPIYENELILYPYFEEQGKGFYVIPVGDQVYTGNAIKPDIKVYDSISYADDDIELIELVNGKDYTVTYKNNKNVNTSSANKPTITVKGKGNYSGTSYTYFNITPKSIEDSDIKAENITTAYNKKLQKLSPSVYRNEKKLQAKTDYTLSYPQTDTGAYQNAGVYPIIIKGTKNYKGTITVYETISNKTLLSKVSISKIPNQTYKNELVDKEAGKGIAPDKLTVTYQKKLLTESTDGGKTGDYTITYSNNMSVGTATATITAVKGSEFSGSKSITYKIVGSPINKAKADGIISKTYTGNETDVLQNNVSLTLNGATLKESKDNGKTGDYIVSYSNISKAGTAAITFKGINEYSGQLKKTYKITGYDISNGKNAPNTAITIAYSTENSPSVLIPVDDKTIISSPYMKGKTKPEIKLYLNGAELLPQKDFTIKYANNSMVTTSDISENKLPKLTVTGKGNFKGSFYLTWRITDGEMSDTNHKLTMRAKDIVYKPSANNYKTTLTITDANGAKLAAGKDYDKNVIYTYAQDNTNISVNGKTVIKNAGDAVGKNDIISADTLIKASVRGIGAYIGDGNAMLSTIYRIIASDISKAKVTVSSKPYQNGKPVELTSDDIKDITINNIPLKYGEDYIIDSSTYTNNIKKGKASVILRGIGKNYGGEKKITFTIGSKLLSWWKTTN